jgi:dihydrofolate reductase
VSRPLVSLVAAVAANGVIGRDGQLPWRLPEDLKFFRSTTMGAPVLMGRHTWDALPPRFRPLPGRRNLVLTRQSGWQAEGAEVVRDLADALARTQGAGRLFVIGGAQVYAHTLPRADELVLTEIDRAFDGDTHFPPWPRAAFAEVARERHHAAPPNDFDFDFVTYRRRTGD